MNLALRILPAADQDIDDAALYFARDNIELGLRFYDAVDATLRKIHKHPNRHPRYEFSHPRLQNVRKRSVIGFPKYLVFYHVTSNAVEVIRVLHGARDIPSVLVDH